MSRCQAAFFALFRELCFDMAHSSIYRSRLKVAATALVIFLGCVSAQMAVRGVTMVAIWGLGALLGALIAILFALRHGSGASPS
ncbi:MAG TPA: hypothetical protein VGN12_27450 [Pirellulales bacterium]|jgi:hypothetical protein